MKLCLLKDSNMKSFGKNWKYYGTDYHGYDGYQRIIECPNHNDILSGRGNRVNRYPGNTVLRNIVVSKLDEYMNLKSCDITKFTWDIVHLLKNKYGVRFLKEETIETNGNLCCWVEVSNENARLKVRVAFRDQVKRQQSQQSQLLQPMMMLSTSDDFIYNNNNNANCAIASNNNTKKKKKKKTATTMQHNQEQLTSLSTSEIQKQLQAEENTDSGTSIFLSMTGAGGGSCDGCGSKSNSTTISKKRQLQTNACVNCMR